MAKPDITRPAPIRLIKSVLPASLFGRALLILVVPTVLVQLVVAYIFYERHWDNVSRHMSASLAGEMAFLVHEVRGEGPRKALFDLAHGLMAIDLSFEAGGKITITQISSPDFNDFARDMERRIPTPFTIGETEDSGGDNIKIRIAIDDGVLVAVVSKKRLVSATTSIFILWMVGTSVILLLIATIFLRNQIRPISRLAEAAESFGKGQDSVGFRPQGASEVRKAARAFITMRERIKRQISTRTEMLAGISHDLRTPLTRMKLQLAMLGDTREARDLQADVSEMEHMIQEYLDFARGDSKEETEQVLLSDYLREIADSYRRQQRDVVLNIPQDVEVFLRRATFRRCLNNLIDNAFRYGHHCMITTRVQPASLEISIDDDGPGISEEHRDIVFHPFKRLDPSRNQKTGGVGLGLSIARDVVLSHGGRITLFDSPLGGLRVMVTLPL